MTTTSPPSLSVIIPTLNAAQTLPETVQALGLKASGMRLIISDGGSTDDTCKIAEDLGALVVKTDQPSRGKQLAAGADAATTDWLLFLHADTTLSPNWLTVCQAFSAHRANANRAGYGRLRFGGERTFLKDLMEAGVAWRSKAWGWPFGDQALLIRTQYYRDLGGYRPVPLFEDVDLVRAVGRKNLSPLPITATTSAARYESDGYIKRMAKNLSIQLLYRFGLSPERLARLYR